ncbi:response regulator transcription factor [Streptomyces sp. RKAG293]|uniref:response regulator transcription factor n=1 Tax=Streptomyces sp. RKAG293 TaxID=2893403 RepID=UPI002033E16D|nr:response regulator transcription factor [Streptomyces sp. RKAG293]MCM2422816.1 response regulator transcription factor [Streptomyces sp. RKAG293]
MRVLVVDDERRLASVIRRGLEAEGYAVDVCHDGRHGLRMALQHPYQVIILDIMLPGLNGYRVCELLRREGIRTPILMLTAKNGEWDEAEALDTGADDYLTKPFSYVVLLARLRALLRRGGPVRQRALQIGDLHIDPATRRCRRGEREIELTAKEFAVLAYLGLRSGEVVTRSDLLEQAWDANQQAASNIIDVHIRALRRKIDVPFGRSTIHTVRGAGYRLADHA